MNLFNAKLTDMRENPWNSNRMDEEHFEGLVQSISDYPDMLKAERVVVRELGGNQLEILGGAHRFRAATLLKFNEMPVGSVGVVSDDKAKLISLVLNNRGTESYDRKMNVIYSIKAVYDVSDIARKIGMDAVKLNGIIDAMAGGVDAMASTAADAQLFGDAVPDGFKLTIDPPTLPVRLEPITQDRPYKGATNESESMSHSFFGGIQEDIAPTAHPTADIKTDCITLPVKANIKKALKIGIANGKTTFEIIDEACKLRIGE